MNPTAARTALKNRLSLSTTDFDGQLDDFVLQAVNRLYPIAQYEVPSQAVDVSVDSYGEAVVDLSTLPLPLLSVRSVEASDGGSYYSISDFRHHGTSLYVRDLSSDVSTLRLYGLKAYELSTVPSYLELAVYWYAMSEFFNLMASSDSHYNIYMQTSGARSVDNMRSEAAFYEQQANVYLNDRAQLYGVS